MWKSKMVSAGLISQSGNHWHCFILSSHGSCCQPAHPHKYSFIKVWYRKRAMSGNRAKERNLICENGKFPRRWGLCLMENVHGVDKIAGSCAPPPRMCLCYAVCTLVCWYFPSLISRFDLSRLYNFFRLSHIFIENENKWEFFISGRLERTR